MLSPKPIPNTPLAPPRGPANETKLVPASGRSRYSGPRQIMARGKGGNNRGSFRDRIPNRRRRPTSGSGGKLANAAKNANLQDVAWLAGKAWQGVKLISSLINVEEKVKDTVYPDIPSITNTGSVFNLSNIAEGNDYNQRDGNSVLCQSLYVGVRLVLNIANPGTVVRLMIFADNGQRGTDPAVTDVLEIASTISPILRYTAGRYNILHDRLYDLSAYQSVITDRVNLKYNKHIYFQNTASADGSDWQGALYGLVICDVGSDFPAWEFSSRLLYTDN